MRCVNLETGSERSRSDFCRCLILRLIPLIIRWKVRPKSNFKKSFLNYSTLNSDDKANFSIVWRKLELSVKYLSIDSPHLAVLYHSAFEIF